MCKAAYALALALVGCAEPTLEPTFSRSTGTNDTTNGSDRWYGHQLANSVRGEGHLNPAKHRRYDAKVRDMLGLGAGPISDTRAQSEWAAVLGALTNESGFVVRVQLVSGAWGDAPNDWVSEDRMHAATYLGGDSWDAWWCMGENVAEGARDTRRTESWLGFAIGDFQNTDVPCWEISDKQQTNQAYLGVQPPASSYFYPIEGVLAKLAYPRDQDTWECYATGDCTLGECSGAWALFEGEMICVEGCETAYVDIGEAGPSCVEHEADEASDVDAWTEG